MRGFSPIVYRPVELVTCEQALIVRGNRLWKKSTRWGTDWVYSLFFSCVRGFSLIVYRPVELVTCEQALIIQGNRLWKKSTRWGTGSCLPAHSNVFVCSGRTIARWCVGFASSLLCLNFTNFTPRLRFLSFFVSVKGFSLVIVYHPVELVTCEQALIVQGNRLWKMSTRWGTG